MFIRPLFVVSLSVLLVACNSSGDDDSSVEPNAAGALVKTSATELTSYFRETLTAGIGDSLYKQSIQEDLVSAPAEGTASGASAGFSTTQLQEIGVDEADVLKSDGEYVYRILNDGNSWGTSTPNKIGVFSLSDDGRNLSAVTEVASADDQSFSAMYLDTKQQQLVALETTSRSVWGDWFMPEYFIDQSTGLSVIDISDPAAANVTQHLSFQGALVASRRIGDSLYMVLRHFPSIAPWYPYAQSDDERAQNAATLDALDASDLLPVFTHSTAGEAPLVVADDCYLNGEESNRSGDVITLVALDLRNPASAPVTQCYVGQTEAIYVSTKALYLASTRWDYDWASPEDSYDPQTTTDIHKFAFVDAGFEYRGSAEVGGHLGFDQNRKSFRFSEHNDHLRVMTINEQRPWFGIAVDVAEPIAVQAAADSAASSPVMLSILKESSTENALEHVAQLPNENRPDPIGKEGEQLYATRYIGDRGYAVTFRVTDPLYVLDLSDPADPYIAGELEVDGYSDYLFPVSENVLLGVGKDAIPDETGWGDQRGAWYQGVKLSLIDVTDPANPVETDKQIIGKRGTESNALGDHHAISMLNTGSETRIALPVSLHDRVPSYGLNGEPWQRYAYTHTGLYRFSVAAGSNTFSDSSLTPLVAHQASDSEYGVSYASDRSLLTGEAVHYFHQDQVISQDWQGLETAQHWP